MNALLQDKRAFATPLLLLAYKEMGDDLFEFEPETIAQALGDKGGRIPQCNLDKINAAIGLLTTNLFWQDPITFGVTCRTLDRATHVNAAPPNLANVLWAITEARLITGNPEEAPEEFSDPIIAYIKELLRMDRISTPVPTLDFIKPEDDITGKPVDSDYQVDSYNTSIERVNDLEQETATKMVTMLKQIKDLHIDISKEAAADIESILQGK